tara:strand:- start:2319 stop:3482 length:1164 start_codon:yes stop_codon:yes gene_type:complete
MEKTKLFKIKSINLPHIITLLFIVLTPILSIIFELTSIPVPAYLFISFVSLILIIGQLNLTTFSLKISKFNLLHFIYIIYFFIAFYSLYEYYSFKAPLKKMINIFYVIIIPFSIILFSSIISKPTINLNFKNLEVLYLKYFKYSLFVFLIIYFLFREIQVDGRYILAGLNNPIWVSRYIGGGFVIFLLYVLINKKINYTNAFLGLFFFLCLINSGSRGPLISAIITIFVFLFKNKIKSKKLFIVSIITILFFIVYTFMDEYLSSSKGYSIYDRINSLSLVFENILNLKGNGLASFGRYFYGEDINYYPHNLVAELFFEFGLIGLLIALFLIYVVLKSYSYSLIGYFCLYAFFNSFISGDIPGNSPLFISLIMAWFLRNNHKINKNES